MVSLSVNINKVATLRNSRGGALPSVVEAARICLAAGAPGLTVHPRADRRHITPEDVRDVAGVIAAWDGAVEYNLEGDPRDDFIALVREVHPIQCTLVPVLPGEITSQAGWPPSTPADVVEGVIRALRSDRIRVSLFIEASRQAVDWAAGLGADRIELYTEPYARAWEQGGRHRDASYELYAQTAAYAHQRGLGINAGHDLNLDNLPLFTSVPHLAEVSIGHALISHALFVGLDRAVRDYLNVLKASDRSRPGV